jgi:hypothetical protein
VIEPPSSSLLTPESVLPIGHLLNARFKITEAPRSGGMSFVFKAQDALTGAACAIKITKPDSNPEFAALAFERELKFLGNLSHENIVQLVDAGRADDLSYLVLEWLESSLKDKIRSSPPWDWLSFYVDIGRPVLLALSHAHLRGIAHRDLKPDNLLFDRFGVVKIVDFGIANAVTSANYGLTLRNAGSIPYTPPEADDGVRSCSRDAYSWAVIATTCLTGRTFGDLGSFQSALDQLDQRTAPVSLIRKAASADPSKRFLSAVDLLVETDAFHRTLAERLQITVPLELSPKANRMLASIWTGTEQDEVIRLVEADLKSGSAVQTLELDQGQGYRIVGATLEAICRRVSPDNPLLRAEELNILGLDRAELMRRQMPSLAGLTFVVCDYSKAVQFAKDARSFETRVRIGEADLERDTERRARERWIDCWLAVLREKERFSRLRKTSYHYRHMQRQGRQYVATCEGEIDTDSLAESLIIKQDSGPILIFKVVDVYLEQIVLELQGNYHELVPMHGGVLESNNSARRQAIFRQRSALETIRRDRAASPTLRKLLCDPTTASRPERSGLPEVSITLSADKHDILERAIGVQSAMAIEGPPGTGKTTLIAELVAIYLKRFPSHRVLLASQTHIALDHVISKLVEKGIGPRIVRIHGGQTAKVATDVLPLTLENKVKKWVEQTEVRARQNLTERAVTIGINRDHAEIALLGQQRQVIALQLVDLEKALADVTSQLDAPSTAPDGFGNSEKREELVEKTTTALDEASAVSDAISGLKQKKKRVEAQLNELGDFGREIAGSDYKTSHEWIAVLNPPESLEALAFAGLLKLQLEWFGRLSSSKDFYGAVLGESSVVAGTCIGLGGILSTVGQQFDLCIIDEVSKATPTETLVPMAYSQRWVLVGDPRQLPPFFESEEITTIEGFTEKETKATLLDIFLRDLPAECKGRLREQRRMASGIGELVATVFYGGDLETVRTEADRSKVIRHLFPKSVTWCSTSKGPCAEVEQAGKTFRNPRESSEIADLLETISKGCEKSEGGPVHVAIISAYSAQVRGLELQLASGAARYTGITYEVNTVDAFQGRDADICIYSVTRSNPRLKLGFQREVRRLNVALSRGRDALVIVGDDQFCRSVHKENPFLDVLAFIDDHPELCEVRVL